MAKASQTKSSRSGARRGRHGVVTMAKASPPKAKGRRAHHRHAEA